MDDLLEMVHELDTSDEKVILAVDWNEMYEKLVEVPWYSIQIEWMMHNYLLNKEMIYQWILPMARINWLSAEKECNGNDKNFSIDDELTVADRPQAQLVFGHDNKIVDRVDFVVAQMIEVHTYSTVVVVVVAIKDC